MVIFMIKYAFTKFNNMYQEREKMGRKSLKVKKEEEKKFGMKYRKCNECGKEFLERDMFTIRKLFNPNEFYCNVCIVWVLMNKGLLEAEQYETKATDILG